MSPLYLDYNATTPLAAEVREAMEPYWVAAYGNPSSIHSLGRVARAALDDCRERLARLWHCRPSEILFTGGGTEANNAAILGAARSYQARGRHLVISAVEHASVHEAVRHLTAHEGFESTQVRTDPEGRVHVEDILEALRSDTVLVSIMAANNEVGTLQPVAEIGRELRSRGILFHTDAAQLFGKEPIKAIGDLEADLVTACAHKLHGPKGVGALFVRSPTRLVPLLLGGGQELERRAGTENLAGIAGFVTAMELFATPPVFSRAGLEPRMALFEASLLKVPGVCRWGPDLTHRLVNTIAVTADGCDSLSLVAGLDMAGVCASGGSACSSGAVEPSRVLVAMGATRAQAEGLVRFSIGPTTTDRDLELASSTFREVVARVRN